MNRLDDVISGGLSTLSCGIVAIHERSAVAGVGGNMLQQGCWKEGELKPSVKGWWEKGMRPSQLLLTQGLLQSPKRCVLVASIALPNYEPIG
jgi:hypothetical protein